MMKNNKSILQKTAYFSGTVSFIAAVVCMVFLYLKVTTVGWGDIVSASLMASTVFFVSVGFVLVTIGKSNLPSFKFDDTGS